MSGRNDDNRANQLNPNHDAYWQSRGHVERPDGWKESTAYDDEDDDEGLNISTLGGRTGPGDVIN